MQNDTLVQLQLVYDGLMKTVGFEEIEHVPDQFMPEEISVQQNCLCIAHNFFNKYYSLLMRKLAEPQSSQPLQKQWVCELLLAMNGENDKAWNFKKTLLLNNQLDIERQLRFNAAVCLKNKKSSSYYDFRLKLYQQLIKQGTSPATLKSVYLRQMAFIGRVLGRFFRNYYCWMYRNRLFQLFLPHLGDQLVDLEIVCLHKFIDTNPNDYSAYSRLIAVVKNNTARIQAEHQWLDQLEDFCRLAFQHHASYLHIKTYRQFLKDCKQKQQH